MQKSYQMNLYPYIIILSIVSILKYLYSLGMEPVPDEAYYWEWSRHLDFSYYDQGPGIGLYIRFFTSLFGDNLFAIKLAAVTGGFLTSLFVLLTARDLSFTKKQFNWVLLFMLLIPGFSGGSILIMHDTGLLLFWGLAIFSIVRYLKSSNSIWIYVLFASLGFGALSKHTMVFFAVSLVLWLIISPARYSLLKNANFWGGILLALAIIAPVLVWNSKNNWENVDAIINLRSAGGAAKNSVTTPAYLAGQTLAFSPLWFGALLLLVISYKIQFFRTIKTISGSLLEKFRSGLELDKDDFQTVVLRFLVLNAAILPVFFLFMSLRKDIQANWVFGSYLSVILLMGYAADRQIPWKKEYKVFLQTGLVLAVIMNIFTFFSIPIINATGLKLDPHYTPGYRYDGFQEIADRALVKQKEVDSGALFAASRYQDAAILSWSLPGKPYVSSLNILMKNQYNRWPGLETGKNYMLVYISEKACAKSFVFFQPFLKSMFEEVREFPEETIIRDGKVIKRFQIWYLRNYQKSWAIGTAEYIGKMLPQEFMPNLKGTEPYQMKSTMSMGPELLFNYLNREGEFECSIFLK